MEALKRDLGEHACARAAGVGVCGEIRALFQSLGKEDKFILQMEKECRKMMQDENSLISTRNWKCYC